MTRSIAYTVPGSGAAKDVKIVAQSAGNSWTVYSGSVSPGTRLTQEVDIAPGGNIKIYVNGELAEDKTF